MKKKLLLAGFLTITGCCLFGLAIKPSTNPQIARAEETEIVEEEPVAEEEQIDVAEETTNKFRQIWDSYLLPAILSINLVSLSSAGVSIFFAVKNRKSRKEYNEGLAKLVKQVLTLTQIIADYAIALASRNEQVKELLQALKSAEATAIQQVELFEQEKKDFENLKVAVLSLINLEVDFAKVSPEFVRSGLAEQAVALKEQLLAIA